MTAHSLVMKTTDMTRYLLANGFERETTTPHRHRNFFVRGPARVVIEEDAVAIYVFDSAKRYVLDFEVKFSAGTPEAVIFAALAAVRS